MGPIAPAYRDMLRYAWRKTDLDYSDTELTKGPPPDMVQQIQFEFDHSHNCEVANCTRKAFIKCSHNGLACLKHFMAGKCNKHPIRGTLAEPETNFGNF